MNPEVINYKDEEYRNDLLQRLQGSVFHLTTQKAYDQITQDQWIYHNKNERFPLNSSSVNSFGRKRGWICLFDLRDTSQEVIDETIAQRYNFLGPSWFKRCEPDFEVSQLAYLILNSKYYDNIIPNETARREYSESKKYEHYVPKTESWYPGNMPLRCVQRVLLVTIYTSAPKESSVSYALYQLEVERQRNRSNP